MTLQLYILRQLAVSIAFALAGISVMVLPAITIQAVYKLEGAPLGVVLDYLPLVVVELVPYFLPVAFLLGVVATFGRLAADNEWTAIRMAGIHPLRTFLPGAAIAVVFAFGTHHLLTEVSPDWKLARRTSLRDAEKDAYGGLGRSRKEFEIGNVFWFSADSRDPDGVFR